MAKFNGWKMLNEAACGIRDTAALVFVICALGFTASKAPDLHNSWMRSKVGSRTYMIQIKPNGGGGTGFAMKANSGITYVVTNDHICNHAVDGRLLVSTEDGRSLWRRVIERSDFTDLCIVEGMPGDEGLSLGAAPRVGDSIDILGHPQLRPLTLSKGEIIGNTDVPILDFFFPTGDPLIDMMLANVKQGTCDLPKNQIVELQLNTPFNIGALKICFVVTKAAYMSNVIIFPGNSGSAVVNYWGKVIGVAFASDNTNWAYIVSHEDLAKMLAKY